MQASRAALESDEITAPQRARRRDTLTELFGEVPIPVIDLYLSQHNPHLRLMRRALQPATWHLLRVRESDPAQTEMPVFVGEPEPGRPGVELAGGALADMFPIQPWIEDRLRDIFSLRHLPDADLTGEDDGGLAPAQPPDRPPPGPDPALAAEQAEWRPIGLEEQPAYLRHRIDEDGDEPEQVSI